MLRLGMPVRKIDTRSFLGAGGTVTPGYSTGISWAGSGFWTKDRNCESLAGTEALNRSF